MMVEMDPLARRLARWAADTRDEIASSDPDVPDELDDRAADNWRPLLAVADAGGSWWPHKAREAASSTLARREEQDHAVALLDDLRTVFGQQERLPSKQILVALHAMEDRPWSEYGKKQEPITPHQLAALLRPFDITPKKWREGGQTVRGYIRADFTDTWDRWLKPLIYKHLVCVGRWRTGGISVACGGLWRVAGGGVSRSSTRGCMHLKKTGDH
jgi:hypothetical protein